MPGDFKEEVRERSILNAVGTYVYKHLKSNKVLINPPQGAFYLMPEFKNKKFKTSSELCDVILNETGVAMLPGSDFGFSPKKMLTRLSYTDFDGVNFFKNVKEQVIKDKLINCTSDAFQKEVFGAPTFIINNKIFWGQDRLEYALEEISVN